MSATKKYKKKPVVIEAIKYTGENYKEVYDFCNGYSHRISEIDRSCFITTLEGRMLASEGDYIIKGVNGEFYPCNPDIFKKTYEEVHE